MPALLCFALGDGLAQAGGGVGGSLADPPVPRAEAAEIEADVQETCRLLPGTVV